MKRVGGLLQSQTVWFQRRICEKLVVWHQDQERSQRAAHVLRSNESAMIFAHVLDVFVKELGIGAWKKVSLFPEWTYHLHVRMEASLLITRAPIQI